MTPFPPELEALMPEPAGFRTRYRSEPEMIGHYPWTYADAERRRRKYDRPEHEYEDLFTADQVRQVMLAVREWAAKKVEADTKRLDWLDGLNRAMNKHYGTTYQWRLVLSPNVVRLMAGRWVGDIDLHDSDARGVASCRIAIDGAIEATDFKLAAAIRGGGQGS